MTRVDPTAPVAPQQRRHFALPRFSLRRFFLLGFLVGIVWVGVLVARTGLVRIPLLTPAFYDVPAARSVTAGTERDDPAGRLQSLTSGALTLSNAELSDLARAGADQLRLGLANVQVAGGTDQPLELSFTLPQRHDALVRIELSPRIDDGDLTFDVYRTRIGNVDVPRWFIGQPTRLLIATQLRALLDVAPPVQSAQVVERGLALRFAAL